MSIDEFGNSPAMTHEEMVAAGYVDENSDITPKGTEILEHGYTPVPAPQYVLVWSNIDDGITGIQGPYISEDAAKLSAVGSMKTEALANSVLAWGDSRRGGPILFVDNEEAAQIHMLVRP